MIIPGHCTDGKSEEKHSTRVCVCVCVCVSVCCGAHTHGVMGKVTGL